MELFRRYGDYGIRYCQLGGTTHVEWNGQTMKSFIGKGEMVGDNMAVAWIDHEMRLDD